MNSDKLRLRDYEQYSELFYDISEAYLWLDSYLIEKKGWIVQNASINYIIGSRYLWRAAIAVSRE